MEHFLKSITLRGTGRLGINGLIVVVGPNSSGKTQLLRDLIYPRKDKRELVVSSDHELQAPQAFSEFIEELKKQSVIRVITSGTAVTIRPNSSIIGKIEGSALGHIDYADAEKRYNEWQKGKSASSGTPFIGHFAPMLGAYLFMKDRLSMIDTAEGFDHEKEIPKNEIQSLHVNTAARESLNKEIGKAFGKGIGLDHTSKSLFLRVTETPSQSAPAMYPDSASQHRRIDDEGDGLRSYVAICLALLVGYRPLCLIDEPESCLHPPQAFSLGNFVGKHATEGNRTVVIATHSSQFLRGIVESGCAVTIVRLTRKSGEFTAHSVEHNVLKDAVSRPSIAADEIFDGLFADGVIIVEAHNDRMIYQAALLAASQDFHVDVQFVTVEGTGGIAPAANFYRVLRIPCVVIADLDVIVESPTSVRNLLEGIGVPAEELDDLLKLVAELHDELRAMPPTMTAEEAVAEFKKIETDGISWSDEGDFRFVDRLRELARRVERSRRIKKGAEGFEDVQFKERLVTVIDACKKRGLFLVPVGDLENWMKDQYADVRPKAGRATAAVQAIRANAEEARAVMTFMAEVGSALNKRRIELA